MNIEETINKMKLLSEYDPKTALNEWRVDCRGWLNIGVIPNGSPFLGSDDNDDMYVMVNPNAEKIDDMSSFKYRNVVYNTKPDGTGATADVPSYKLEDIEIYPEYRDTYYGELFLGRMKGEEDKKKHEEFMSRLNIVNGGQVLLKHSSSVKITDGYVSYGKKNPWSNNSDIGIYFWGSKRIGRDQSNIGQYTYICTVNMDDIYDFETNLERFPSLKAALKVHPYCAQQWKDEVNVIVVNTLIKTPIKAIRDNSNGTVYDSEWKPIDMKIGEGKSRKNFIHEYKPSTCNNAELVSINEINAKTMLQRHGDSGFIVISPCRGYSDFNIDPSDKSAKQKLSEINNDRIRQMIAQIKNSGYSYTPVYGGFIENIGTKDEESVYERSFVIYNKKRDGSEGDMNDLVKFGQSLARQYNQDSFLVKANGQRPKYITKDGDIDMEFSGNTSFNDFSQEYFTDLHKNTDKYSNIPNKKPTRFSYTESYINPGPQCYSERHVRSLNGEVFLTETVNKQKFQNPKFIDEGYKERKEEFRKRHERATSDNELVMERFYGIHTNDNKPVLIEHVTLDRILKKHGANGMINISANRSDMPKEYNEENTKKLIEEIIKSGFSYLPTYGGYRDDGGVEDDYEPSFVVFNYDAKNGNPRDFNELYKLALEWCGTYNQHSVLIKAPNQDPIYVDRNGHKVNDDESDRYWKNDPKQNFFTSFKSKDDVDKEIKDKIMGKYKSYCHKNNIPLTKDGFKKFYQEHLSDIDSIGRRYTYDIRFECYVNPMPLQISERMKRKGEVMIWE